MEVFRGVGGLAEAVKARSPPLALWRKFVYCESLTGHILGSVDHFEVRTGLLRRRTAEAICGTCLTALEMCSLTAGWRCITCRISSANVRCSHACPCEGVN